MKTQPSGGLADPDHPDDDHQAQPIMRLFDFMERLTACEETTVHLDLKFIKGASHIRRMSWQLKFWNGGGAPRPSQPDVFEQCIR